MSRIVFDSGASPYTINVSHNLTITFLGISDSSTVPQTFAVSGRLTFDSASAGKAHIHNLGASVAGGPAGITEFAGTPDLRYATIINEGGTAPGAAGGSTLIMGIADQYFFGTLIVNGGSNGGWGGRVIFTSTSLFDPTRLVANSGGTFDFSGINNPINLGSIEGTGDIFLSNNGYAVVVTGGNGMSPTFAGIIHDGKNPTVGGVFGRTSVGSNTTLSLISANTYSGGTIITGDVLEARHEGALGRGDVILQNTRGNAKLILQGAATNDYISDTATLNVDQSSIANLNYTGAPEVVGFLIVNGVSQSAGLYGGPSSGAPNVVPEFQGTGTILVVQPSAASRKLHGGTNYYLSLPFTRPYAVECRSGGNSNSYEVSVSFGLSVTCNNAVITSGSGTVTSVVAGGSSVIVSLSDVVSPQTLMLRLDLNYGGLATGSAFVPMNVVVGDVTGDTRVNASDVIQTKSSSGQPVSATNFRIDVNTSGQINAGDIALVKSKSGTALAPTENLDIQSSVERQR